MSLFIMFVVVVTLAAMLWVIRRETQMYARARRRKARRARKLDRKLRRAEKTV